MRKLVYILSLLAVMLPVTLWAEQTRQQDGQQPVADGQQDSVSVSLLTVTPGKGCMNSTDIRPSGCAR